jgi:hypothetical protein
MTEARCRICDRFLAVRETRCPGCGWIRPRIKAPFNAQKKTRSVTYGETPEVLRRLPLERIGREQKWRDK